MATIGPGGYLWPDMPTPPAPAPSAEPLLHQPDYDVAVKPVGSYRWVILSLVFLATTINYVDRLVMGILSPQLREQYHISLQAYGQIQAAFAIVYAFGQLAAGWWLDRIGTRIGYAISLTAWSIASMLHALARSALGFGLARGLLGICESPNFPAAVKTLAEWFPKRERAFAMGVVNAGSNVGAIVAPLAVPWIAIHWGWQWSFIATGAIGLLWVALWAPIYRRPHEHPKVSKEELAWINSDPAEPATKVRWTTLFGYRQTWAFAAGKFLTDPVWWFLITWMAEFFKKRFNVSLGQIGVPMVIVMVMADVGSIVGGWMSSNMLKLGWSLNRARKTTMFLCALGVVPIVFAAKVTNMWFAVALLGLAVASHQGWSSNLYTLVSDMFPRRAVASVAGLGGTCGYLGATIFSYATGFLLIAFNQSYTVLFVIAGSAYLVAFLCVQLLAPRLETVEIPDPSAPAFPM